ncbi:MAG: hypothetical protein ABIF06_00590 [bacterium]
MGIDYDNLPARIASQLIAGGHHAYLLVGPRVVAEAYFYSVLDALGVKASGNPDVFLLISRETFGIDEARELSVQASRKSFVGKKFFLISAERLTLEAQNALLKIFEDPSSDTHFFLVTRERGLFIPTLLSRMQIVGVSTLEQEASELENPELFLKLSLKERLNYAREFADKGGDIATFLDQLLLVLRGKNQNGIKLKRVYDLRRYADNISHSPRLILEHLSLVV